ncbi:hypothetical protein BWI96_18945 [Siphonobacter sp. SORGH_AS_0500]|uniref:hypothetical protein n=1 Tax=Siphonobacter sp. SORGH_AS_0500 TaxID=1864824 RepID=UPI000CC4CEDD|nr:hypothetical protein [Siphonobacter sp. SORGH_AS_0500]PKK35132.1 hypothetical protein BWI96_18945 [Siphonobacter sp. SORGH_AS_0500]
MKLYVPARSYLVKFAQVRYGSSVVVNRNDSFSHLCLMYLILGRHRSDYARTIEKSDRYNDRLTLDVSTRFFHDYGAYHITPFTTVNINQFLDKEFKAEFVLFVREKLAQGFKIVQAIDAFREFYSLFEEDIADETLKKNLQRRGVWKRKTKHVPISRGVLQQPRQLCRA